MWKRPPRAARLFMPITCPSPETRCPTFEAAVRWRRPQNLAGVFVADHHRHGNCAPRPFVPVVDMDVGAADAGFSHPNENVVGADYWHGLLFEPKAGFRSQFHQGFHEVCRVFVSSRREVTALFAAMKVGSDAEFRKRPANISADAEIWQYRLGLRGGLSYARRGHTGHGRKNLSRFRRRTLAVFGGDGRARRDEHRLRRRDGPDVA